MAGDWIANDAATFVNTDEFGELITYTPYEQSPVTIPAQVFLNSSTAINGLHGATAYKHEIAISRTTGLPDITTGRDSVTLYDPVDGSAETFAVLLVIQVDAGIWHLGVG